MPVLPAPEEDDDSSEIPPWPCAAPEVTETDNPVTGVLYGPTGDVLVEVRERRTIPFGYRKRARRGSKESC